MMRALRRFLSRARNTFARHQYEERLRDEIDQHIAMQAEDNLRAGLPPTEARRQAVIKFGAVEAIKEDHRAEQVLVFLQTFFQDLRYGVRNLRNSKGFTTIALLTLALGIGGNTLIFSAINGILIEHLPYANASRLLSIQRQQVAWGLTPREIQTIRQQCPALDRVEALNNSYFTLTIGDGLPMQRWIAQVSGGFFSMLDVKPLMGRFIVPADTEPGGPLVAVLSYRFWMSGFGGDPNAVGRDIVVDKTHYSVIGVMPKMFELGVDLGQSEDQDGLWVPLTDPPPNRRLSRVIGLVKEGVALQVAMAQIQAAAPAVGGRFPKDAKDVGLRAEKPKRWIDQDVRAGLLILQGAAAFVLLIASVNLSVLLVSRAWSRHRDLAIRKALGASRWRIVRQLLTEGLLLASAGGALGVLFAAGGIPILRSIAPPGTPRLDRMQLDNTVLWFTLAISLFSVLLFALLPALAASEDRKGGALKGGLRALVANPMVRRRNFLRNGLLIAEVGLAVVLLVGGTLMVRSFDKLIRVDTGVRSDHALTMFVEMSESACQPSCELAVGDIWSRINSLPGVERAALSVGGALGGGWMASGILLEGDSERSYDGYGRAVTPGFFETVGMRLQAGRDFAAADRTDVAIVSEEFARKYIIGNPLGKRFSIDKDSSGRPAWMEIVGVVNDTRDRAVRFYGDQPYYTPFRFQQNWWQASVRTSADPLSLAIPVQRAIRSVDKAAIITEVKTLDQALAESAALPKFQASLFGLFGLLALLLAAIGVYGTTYYSVSQRTHEIGIRIALGARAEDVVRRIVTQGGVLALVGIGIGLVVAPVLARSLQTLLFQIQPVDLATYAGAAILLLAVALAACYFPARAASRVDPSTALRHD